VSKTFASLASGAATIHLITTTTRPCDYTAQAADEIPSPSGSEWLPPLSTNLAKSRIGAKELSSLAPSTSPFDPQEVYFPSWMFGSWNVTAVLKQKTFPYGSITVLPSTSLFEMPLDVHEIIGNDSNYVVQYTLQFYSTLADTLSNQLTVNLGLGVPESKIILNRGQAAKSMYNAFFHQPPQHVLVQEEMWDSRQNPRHITLLYETESHKEGRIDIDILAQTHVNQAPTCSMNDNAHKVFCTSERARIVRQEFAGNVIVEDMEMTTEYTLQDDNHVSAISRIAIFLTPNRNSPRQEKSISGKAIAFYDFEINMHRNLETFVDSKSGKTVERACVLTPKDVIQCA
jgi:DNA-binding protein